MKFNARFTTHVLQALAVGAALASTASAGCGDASNLQPPFQFAQPLTMAMAARATASPGPVAMSNNAMNNVASPVGMWNIQFISQATAATILPFRTAR